MERYKIIFEFENGNEETSYFTENPSSRVNDWMEREKGHWIRLENAMINLANVNIIRVAKVKIDDNSNDEEFIEWV
ncbi:hypothetical protein CR194_15785 [Salipaludibacillus keqinensis]|uniref:Uncharacterized protein n=1 Tax=Salipaludibacillus keqinensis TaxID=2045207 RepID=A0A323TCC7_9BACI|nr:hypothetical protein [Salipaludibacillus keqinensis]PYZ92296.1 hypothetical protein CR194_15785 [Salipaludibacillus keqinensis]